MEGWISIHRKICDHWVWDEKPFCRSKAWIDLLLMVNHTDNKITLDGQLFEVKKGQRITSIRKLANRWGWSTKKVKMFLSVLESDNMLVVKSDNKKTLITVVNYDFYQPNGNTEETQKKHTGNTEEPQKKTNNNEKNVKNEKKEKKIDPTDYFLVFEEDLLNG